MPEDCLFCKIINGEIPSQFVYQDSQVVAFRDIHPLAPFHLLIVPRTHRASVNETGPEDEVMLGHLFSAARAIAVQENLRGLSYRLVVNTGRESGQSVFHLHMHLLAGRPLTDQLG